jgi:hypothetical protein
MCTTKEFQWNFHQTRGMQHSIILRHLLTQKCVQKMLVTDIGCPRACRFRKHHIKNRFPALALPTSHFLM